MADPKFVTVPTEPPDSVPADNSGAYFDEVLFNLCRDDDYHGLYRELVRRGAESLK